MAQLDMGGFLVKQDDGSGTQKISGYVHVEQVDLRNKIEHWVLVVGAASGETPFKVPQASVASSNVTIVKGDLSQQYSSVAAFLDAKYHDPVADGHARRYVKASCEEMTL